MSKNVSIDTTQNFDKKHLALQGVLYPSDMRFVISSPTVNDIRKWHSMDEGNQLAVARNIIDIIKSCVQVKGPEGEENKYSVLDIYEHDKLAFLIAIFDKFNTENKREHNLFVSGSCQNPSCKHHYDKLIVQASNICYKEPSKSMLEKFNHDKGYFELKTKSFDTVKFKPSTIGLAEIVTEFTSTLSEKFLQDNIKTIMEIQSMFTDWRGLKATDIRKAQIEEYNFWSEERKLFQMQLLDNLNVAIDGRLEYICSECRQPFRVAFPIDQINKTMFTPVQYFMDELL